MQACNCCCSIEKSWVTAIYRPIWRVLYVHFTTTYVNCHFFSETCCVTVYTSIELFAVDHKVNHLNDKVINMQSLCNLYGNYCTVYERNDCTCQPSIYRHELYWYILVFMFARHCAAHILPYIADAAVQFDDPPSELAVKCRVSIVASVGIICSSVLNCLHYC